MYASLIFWACSSVVESWELAGRSSNPGPACLQAMAGTSVLSLKGFYIFEKMGAIYIIMVEWICSKISAQSWFYQLFFFRDSWFYQLKLHIACITHATRSFCTLSLSSSCFANLLRRIESCHTTIQSWWYLYSILILVSFRSWMRILYDPTK